MCTKHARPDVPNLFQKVERHVAGLAAALKGGLGCCGCAVNSWPSFGSLDQSSGPPAFLAVLVWRSRGLGDRVFQSIAVIREEYQVLEKTSKQ